MDVSLIGGWLPWALQLSAAALLGAAIGRRSRVWLVRRLPFLADIAATVTAVLAVLALTVGGVSDPLPFTLWLWMFAAVFALAAAIGGWRGAAWHQRTTAPLALLLAIVCAGNSLNIFTGYFPTLGDAIRSLSDEPLPQQLSLSQLATVHGNTTTGRIVEVNIPATASGFVHRPELVYLPPAWFRSKHRPKLPVVEMIGGEYASPNNWIVAGEAVTTADAYAAHHHGTAPVLVFVDVTGSFKNDTECVDGVNGNAQSHLVKDIPPYIEQTFGTSADPGKWAVAGWSMGGTCAITLTVTHPGLFKHFIDISGDLGPNLGDKQSTITKLYGGNEAAYNANDPRTVLATHGRYRGVSGWFAAGDQEHAHIAQQRQLCAAMRGDGINCQTHVTPGAHKWTFASTAFRTALPWLGDQFGIH